MLLKDLEKTAVYNEEILKLEKAGYVKKILPETVNSSAESWYLPIIWSIIIIKPVWYSIVHSDSRKCA